MKTLIVSLNSKYIHTSLAPWYLKAECDKSNKYIINIIELTVNIEIDKIFRSICCRKPDVIAFSCYIFNIETVEKLVNDIKKVLPGTTVILGGPEVSYDPEEQLKKLKDADYIISGEGEKPFAKLLGCIENGMEPRGIPGVTYRTSAGIVMNAVEEPPEFDALASPYTDELLEAAAGKIIYYESSRGCPFSCSYCLSSETSGARFLSLPRVKSELLKLLSSRVKQIKFVDRTFNCNRKHAKEIFRFLINCALDDKTGKIAAKNVHFEMAADLFDDEMLEILKTAPNGFFQFEIGIQSFNESTLSAVSRKTNLDLCAANIKRLLSFGNIHIHLDLIAGLPFEDLSSFASSFNKTYSLHPHVIQLGFLKLLKGSGMRREADNSGYAYTSRPPYEVLKTPWLGFSDICLLKNIEEASDRLYNSGKFLRSCDFMAARFASPYDFFAQFAGFLDDAGYFKKSVSLRDFYGLFLDFARNSLGKNDYSIFAELLKYDFFSSDNSEPPSSLPKIENSRLRELYRAIRLKLPNGTLFRLETFKFNPAIYLKSGSTENGPVVLCFDYSASDRVTGLYRSYKIDATEYLSRPDSRQDGLSASGKRKQ